MPSLKDLRTSIGSVKSTRKITSAMKMVAASKLRQAQARAESARPYAIKMAEALARLILAIGQRDEVMPLLDGTGREHNILYIAVAADRGLAGGFNANLVRDVRRHINSQALESRNISIITVGKKARDLLRRDFGSFLIDHVDLSNRYETAEAITTKLIDLYKDGKFDVAYVGFSEFKNIMLQQPVINQVIPFIVPQKMIDQIKHEQEFRGLYNEAAKGIYSFEPDAKTLLERLIPQQVAAQIYSVLLEVAAGEQAARMTAMDNATRNAGDMINRLTLQYNRARQAYITKEMIEIVSGAEAV